MTENTIKTEEDLLARAATALQANDLDAAAAALARRLDESPDDARALHFLGLVRMKQGAVDQALPCFERAAALTPTPLTLGNLATALKALRRFDEAEAAYRRALVDAPSGGQILLGLGTLLWTQKRLDEAVALLATAPDDPTAIYFRARVHEDQGADAQAEAAYRTLLQRWPNAAEAANDFALLLARTERKPEALRYAEAAVAAKPTWAEAQVNLGVLCRALGLIDRACVAFERAFALRPRAAEALTLARLFRARGALATAQGWEARALEMAPGQPAVLCAVAVARRADGGEAMALLEKAAGLAPDDPDVLNELAQALLAEGREDEAEAPLRRAVDRAPSNGPLIANLAELCKAQGRRDEAEVLYRRALALAADDPVILYNFALLLLQQGRFDEAFPAFEARHALPDAAFRPPLYAMPRWQGEALAGTTLLLQNEQGFGDEIQFARGARWVKEQGARVWIMTRPPLVALMRTLPWADRVLTKEQSIEAERCDAWTYAPSLLALPDARAAGPVPYLAADPVKVAAWRDWLVPRGAVPGRIVGVLHAGKPRPVGRSVPVAAFAAALAGLRLSFVSLQRPDEHASLDGLSAIEAGARLVDFSETAALIANLDLLISVDSAPAHLAGALGQPVWTLLKADPDWRWFLDREDSPWYPSMRLFRQQRRGDWSAPLEALRRALIHRFGEG
jgi:Flp pilus assembly protein TadD